MNKKILLNNITSNDYYNDLISRVKAEFVRVGKAGSNFTRLTRRFGVDPCEVKFVIFYLLSVGFLNVSISGGRVCFFVNESFVDDSSFVDRVRSIVSSAGRELEELYNNLKNG